MGEETNVIDVSLETLQDKIYNIRGYKVMILCFNLRMLSWKNFQGAKIAP